MTLKRLTERNALAFPFEQSAGVVFFDEFAFDQSAGTQVSMNLSRHAKCIRGIYIECHSINLQCTQIRPIVLEQSETVIRWIVISKEKYFSIKIITRKKVPLKDSQIKKRDKNCPNENLLLKKVKLKRPNEMKKIVMNK